MPFSKDSNENVLPGSVIEVTKIDSKGVSFKNYEDLEDHVQFTIDKLLRAKFNKFVALEKKDILQLLSVCSHEGEDARGNYVYLYNILEDKTLNSKKIKHYKVYKGNLVMWSTNTMMITSKVLSLEQKINSNTRNTGIHKFFKQVHNFFEEKVYIGLTTKDHYVGCLKSRNVRWWYPLSPYRTRTFTVLNELDTIGVKNVVFLPANVLKLLSTATESVSILNIDLERKHCFVTIDNVQGPFVDLSNFVGTSLIELPQEVLQRPTRHCIARTFSTDQDHKLIRLNLSLLRRMHKALGSPNSVCLVLYKSNKDDSSCFYKVKIIPGHLTFFML